jgi:pimeloyl-ACP methyl ester carboxylesterase
VTVSVTGLGKLTNKILSTSTADYESNRLQTTSTLPMTNSSKTINGHGLTRINGKLLNYQRFGKSDGKPMVFVHGLGGTSEYWRSFAQPYMESYSIHIYDLEGHGLSPTSPLSVLSMASFTADLKGIFDHAGIKSDATLIAHSMGCFIAMSFVTSYPGLVKNLILMGPPPSPLPEPLSQMAHGLAEKARTEGMFGIADAVVDSMTSPATKKTNPIAITALRLSLLGQDPEGYAKACGALAGATTALEVQKIEARSLVVTGDDDKVSPPELCEEYAQKLRAGAPVVLENTGHWHVFENETALSTAVGEFLSS